MWQDLWIAALHAARDAAKAAALATDQRAALNDAASAAHNAAWDATEGEGGAMWDAALDASLAAQCLLVQDHIDPEHLDYALRRWAIWQAGYGLAGKVGGTYYCYKRPQ